MYAHKLRRLAAVHARIQSKGLKRFEKLSGLVVSFLAERVQKIHVVFLEVSALNLDVDAVAYKRKFVFREDSLIRENIFDKRPGLADQPEAVPGSFDAVNTGYMENTNRLVFLESVKEGNAHRHL